MSRRFMLFAVSLAVTLGIAVSGASAASAASASAPNLVVKFNQYSFVATQHGFLSLHLGGPGGGQYVNVFETLPGKSAQFLGDAKTDVHGNFQVKLTMVYNATYSVSYNGSQDGKWYPAVATTAPVHVAAYLASTLTGTYGTSGGYHLVHAGKYTNLGVALLPNKAGEKVYFPVQVYTHGSWHSAVDHAYTLTNHKVNGQEVSGVGAKFTGAKGYAYRIRAIYKGDKYNGGRSSGYYYVKFA